MIDTSEYIKLPKSERQKHLDLESPCVERGGNSTNHKGVLAQYLNTTIPKGRILLCHACGNGLCSNPKHLYWGTDRENIVEDGTKFGTFKTAWEYSVEKYGLEEAIARNAKGKVGNKFGAGNKGKPKTKEHKDKIAQSIKAMYNKDLHS